MKKGLLAIGLASILACNTNTNTPIESNSYNYFQLDSYVDDLYQSIHTDSIHRLLSDDLSKEDSIINRSSFQATIDLVKQLNIGKKAWAGKFDVDTLKQDGQTQITYTSNDQNIQIKSLQVIREKEQEDPVSIKVVKQTNSPISKWTQEVIIQAPEHTLTINNELVKVLGKEKQSNIKMVYTR